jgi:hypothetical protein
LLSADTLRELIQNKLNKLIIGSAEQWTMSLALCIKLLMNKNSSSLVISKLNATRNQQEFDCILGAVQPKLKIFIWECFEFVEEWSAPTPLLKPIYDEVLLLSRLQHLNLTYSGCCGDIHLERFAACLKQLRFVGFFHSSDFVL